jgi:hypothetical protein
VRLVFAAHDLPAGCAVASSLLLCGSPIIGCTIVSVSAVALLEVDMSLPFFPIQYDVIS